MTSVPDLHRLSEANGAVAERIAGLLRSCPDASIRVPGAEWTVAEAAAHLVLANELMAALAAGDERPYGDGTPGSLAAANAASLEVFGERDASVLAEGIVRHTEAFARAAAERDAAASLLSPLGPLDPGTLGSYLLTHMLGHGYDIARAMGRPHMVDGERVGLALPFLMTAMPRVVEPRTAAGHNACYDLRVRGGDRFAVTFTDGTAAVSPEPPRRPDCVIVAEPVTFFLLALGRRGPVGAVARGGIVAWGRKPWLAAGFPGLFTAP
jgi:uncharacterized protein (TIGR03083 family)